MTSRGRIHSICMSDKRGDKKRPIDTGLFVTSSGLLGDAHAGSDRQVSLLPFEAFDTVRNAIPDIQPGAFAENITTQGLDFADSQPGRVLAIGTSIRLVVTHVGKDCHQGCYIREIVGDCIMPRLGIFARVEQGGRVRVGDEIRWLFDEV